MTDSPHDLIPLDEAEEAGAYHLPGAPASPAPRGFKLEPFDAIRFEPREEWLVKRVIPRQGVGVLYGRPGSLKSFVAGDLALHVALGWKWAGRRVTQAPAVYIAAEGAAGLRKRKIGFERAHADLPVHVPFYLISAAPNLGTDQGDLAPLIASIDSERVAPGLVVIDTLAQSLGAGDENGAGMLQFVANATALANHFRAFVLIVHHCGLGDDKRMRGHSSLAGAVDCQILCEREEKALSTILTLQKLKDDAANVRLEARFSRIVIGHDEDGDEVSTLVAETIEETKAVATAKPKTIPRAQRLLMTIVTEAIAEAGETFRPFADGPIVKVVSEDVLRPRFYARIAEQADPGENPQKMLDRQRKAFKRSIEAALKAKDFVAAERNGERVLWLP